MAHERKASEGAGAKGPKSPASPALATSQTSPPSPASPIPSEKKDDLEDVSWALSTAEAMWGRGDHAEALKWLRRAAETAADAEEDDRALELAKAAADVATLITASKPAVTPSVLPAVVVTPIIMSGSHPPPSLPATRGTTPTPPAPPVSTTTPVPPVTSRVAAPLASRVNAAAPSLPRPGQKTPTPPRVSQPPLSRRSGRRSSPSMTDDGSGEKPVATRSARGSATNEARRRSRTSKPAADETSDGEVETLTPARAAAAVAKSLGGDPDQWPTQALAGEDLDDVEHTRIGTPAYQASAQKASARPPNPIAMHTSQAVRVLVWRTAEGVHVAPVGTAVSAIAVEAVLVALDPTADLAAWLTNK
jgi:hypothetical protein